MNPIVLAMTGASGALYGVRLLDVLIERGIDVRLTISPAAVQVLEQELKVRIDLQRLDPDALLKHGILKEFRRSETSPPSNPRGTLTYHHFQDFSSGIASGSHRTTGMVICPCSMGTLAALAQGLSTNLIHRAADVHLKERRKLIVVPRETPLGSIALQNMLTLTAAGGVVLPAMPGFYHRPASIPDLVDFVVARICDQLGVETSLFARWGEADRKNYESSSG